MRNDAPIKYQSGDLIISKVMSHDSLWIVEHPNGKFHTVNSDGSYMLRRYRVDLLLNIR